MLVLVQRPRRKKHLATTTPGSGVWDTLGSCRLSIPVDGTVFTPIGDAPPVATFQGQDEDVCLHCLHLIAFAHLLERRPDLLGGVAPRHLQAVAS